MHESSSAMLADKIVMFANTKGMWPTIDFIVERWASANPDFFMEMKNIVADERNNLKDKYGSNQSKDSLPMRRIVEVPEKIHALIDMLFRIEKTQYTGGEKQFWRDFSYRYPAFQLGK